MRLLFRLIMAALALAAAWGGHAATDTLHAQLERLDAGAGELPLRSRGALQRFYAAFPDQRAWTGTPTADRRLASLVAAIEDSRIQGLEPAHYHLDALRTGLAATPRDERSGAALELLASDAWMLLASHYASGRVNPLSVDPEWHATRRDFDGAQALEESLAAGDPAARLDALLPQQPDYARLLELLARYRSATPWPQVPNGAPLEPGTRDPRVGVLRRRLAASGDLQAEGDRDPALFDPGLEDAVRRFQERHGLKVDGVVGPDTLDALNVPLERRVDQIRVNLERWRWLPADPGRRHIRVNIADYRVEVWDDGEPVLAMKAIVGRAYRRTPVFSGTMTYLVLNPSWWVPKNIALRDKLPEIRRDPGVLERQGFEVWQNGNRVAAAGIDWTALGSEHFPYNLRQLPGPENALGQVKFIFPNPFNVYLHDTPARHLFEREERDLSSGCIRLEKPLELLDWVLLEAPGWSPARARATLAAGEETVVRLTEHIPVHIEYRTAWVDDRGVAQFRADIYARDARIAAALDRQPPR